VLFRITAHLVPPATRVPCPGVSSLQGLPQPAAPCSCHAQPRAASRKIISSPAYNLFQAFFSSDGRWIVFEAVKDPPDIDLGVESDLYVVPVAGGPWTLISKRKPWDDKPRWSPDGKTIYFVSSRQILSAVKHSTIRQTSSQWARGISIFKPHCPIRPRYAQREVSRCCLRSCVGQFLLGQRPR